MRILGLTGSIGMGKSTTAGFFRTAGVPVWDADAAVHRVYAPGGAAVGPVTALVPAALKDGGVDRAALREAILADGTLLSRIEAAVHPVVSRDRAAFLEQNRAAGVPLVVCDIPLLFESGDVSWLDAVLVVTAPPEVQRARVMARPGMTETAFAAILARQVPDAEKRARADHVIDTSRGLDHAEAEVARIIRSMNGDDDA
ncbi:dephospho-CoA kinase [Paroceanicella profunda]|uniref:Dephospho-CoA kinase n=1 Tax=Paroceanicella profunda TaxID=2579971 RepID=A0A5B8FXP5_9RHOB|nr:dephospho-CoA kinase [Paroceanicella profunda]QDL91302.1 dephospho-CoA kinase [Paroceanicella profunda]